MVLVGGAVTVVVAGALVVVVVTVLVVAAGPVVVVGVTDVVDVVVGVWPVTDTAQPVPVAGVIGMASVSYR